MDRRSFGRWIVTLVLVTTAVNAAAQSFVNFESGHVRPLALSPDGTRLFAVNTPDNRLEVFSVSGGTLTLVAEVPVGLEPVAVATRTNAAGRVEAWVVNHLSDSVSIVEVLPTVALSRVTRTLLVGDEPRDIVFAGSAHNRAFITCAHRGQNRTGDPQLTTGNVGRADVWTFNADSLGAPLGGTPLSVVQLFGDTPRALAASPDGSIVYAAVFHSGNGSTAITQTVVTANGGPPPPPANSTPDAPDTGLIVRRNPANNHFEDEIGRDWTGFVPFTLPDQDVFLIDADASPGPKLFTPPNAVTEVGTVLFNMAVRPSNGKVYVTNLEARNEVRFEPVIRGHIAESRVTVITGTTAAPRHLNPHIVYGTVPGPQSEKDQSLAFPLGMAFSATKLFVAGFGSAKVGVFDADALEGGTIIETQIPVGLGPTGVVRDATDHLYVLNRIDQTISVVSNASSTSPSVAAPVALRFDPSPAAVRNGRRFLYDARISGHGDSACASCHIFGDFDSLAWDLGDPFGTVANNPVPFRVDVNGPPHTFHPMKGPMTTQSLRGLASAGVMHWRGDRNGGSSNPLSEDLSFKAFNPAFVGLLGNGSQLSTADMQAFTDFILTVRYPPNPIRPFNNQLVGAAATGSTFFDGTLVDRGVLTCEFCHSRPLGTHRDMSFEGEPQEFKIAHLRNMYQKVGMFAVPTGTLPPASDQVRGFGFLHDGSVPTMFDFLQASVFSFGSNANTKRRNLEAFLLQFDTGLAPIVGQQVSANVDTFTDGDLITRINLMIARAEAGECDVVVKGNLSGAARGWLYDTATNLFRSDRTGDAQIDESTLRNQAATENQERTYTAVPVGSGTRIGLDRDSDGFPDRTEIEAGSDPANAASVPSPTTTTTTLATTTTTTTTVTTTTVTATTSTTVATTTTIATTTTTASTSTTTTVAGTTSSTTTTTKPPTTSTTTTPATTSTTTTTATTTTSTTATTTATTTSSTTLATTTTTTSTTAAPTTSTTVTIVPTTTTTTTTLPPTVLIQASALSLRDDSTPPANPDARRVSFRSSTRSEFAVNRIVVPAAGSAGDPRTGGATLDVYNAAGTGERITVVLPASGWTALGTTSTPKGYRYHGGDGGITTITVKADKMSVKGGGAEWGYTLDESAQGSVALRLQLGSAPAWCAQSGQPGLPPRIDQVDRFLGLSKTPPPTVCPLLP